MAGLPLRFERRGQCRVVHDGAGEPDLVDQVRPGDGRRRGALRREGHVGVGRAEHEIRLFEEVGHGLVELAPVALDGGGPSQGEAFLGRLDPCPHLTREPVESVGVGVPQVGHERRLVGHGPLAAQRREGRRDGDQPQVCRSGEPLGRGRDDLGHLVTDPCDAEVDHDRRRLAGQVVGAERRLPPADDRQAQRVALVEPVAAVEVAGRVAHGTGEAAEHRRQRIDPGGRSLGHPPVGGLEPEQSGEPGGDPDGPAPVAPGGNGQEATRDGGRGAPRRPARGALGVPRVARRPVQLGRSAVDAPELARRRLRGQHGTRGAQAGQRGVVVVRDAVLEEHRCLGVRPALDPFELLDATGDPAEGQRDVGVASRVPRQLEVREAEGVQRRRLHGADAGLEGLERGHCLGPEGLDQAAGVLQPRGAHGAESTRAPVTAPRRSVASPR